MGNARDGDDGHKGTAAGGAVYSYQGATLQLRNSILANSSGANAGGSISDQGFNLSSDATPAFTATGSRSQTDPRLGSLTQSGGLTSLITLTTNSPAVDAITAADGNGAPFFDQRNAFRVEPYDIGAYELGASFSESVLQASLGNNRVLLSWPSLGNYVLQTTPSLSSSSVWTTVAGSPTTGADGMSTLAVAQTNQAGFFRLVSP